MCEVTRTMAHNPFRQHRRAVRDRRDQIRAEIRRDIEPVPDVYCPHCGEAMEYARGISTVEPQVPMIEATWECLNKECPKYDHGEDHEYHQMAHGYVTPNGLELLDNAREEPPADD